MKYLLLLASLIAIYLGLARDTEPMLATLAQPQKASAVRPNTASQHWLTRFYPETASAPPAVDAAVSMAEARLNGETRTPPIERQAQSPAAIPAELADHTAYQKYETRQHQQELAAFARAAPAQIAQLEDDIRQGKALGIAPEQIAQQERKVAELKALRGQVLSTINPPSGH